MRAALFTSYGDRSQLSVGEAEKPAPTDEQLLIRVVASSLNPLDWKLRAGMLKFIWPLKFPFIPGFDIAGVVESVGAAVTEWKVGDAVMAGPTKGGAHAEFAVVDKKLCVAKPESVSFDACAAAPVAAMSALQMLRTIADVQAGQRVLINGASGGVGTFAIQIGKVLNCHVTGVCSTPNVELVRSLGADEVIDYTQEDLLESGPYDAFCDVVPNRTFPTCRPMLNPDGIYITTLPGLGVMGWKVMTAIGRLAGFRQRCGMLMLQPNGDDLQFIADLFSKGQLRSIVENTFPLEQIQEAHALSESGRTRGKIIIRVSSDESESDAE